ncbi:MAG: hypothetical protein IPJ69_06030 [Deltaproteobacteria bacterium]|nr:MAG: hypothetical protein IPJ69_06030 [Deltaproteobacteria bacterium]
MTHIKKLFLFSSLFWILGLMAPMGCGGGATSSSDQTLSDGATPTATEREMKDFDISIRLNEAGDPAALTLDDITYSDSIAAVSLFSQVTHVSIEVIISGSVFSTTELTRSTTDPLIYTGRISIPVDAEVELHAMATDTTARLLFEGNLRGVHAAEFGTPSIQIIMQRQVPVDPIPAPNTPPVIHGTIVARASLAYTATTTMTVDAQDPQRDTLSYLWEVISGPEGATLTGLLTGDHLQGATFTAPSVTGIFRMRITVYDPAGASASREVSVYVSESGRDGTPDTGITISDFPDCVNWAISTNSYTYIGGCSAADSVGSLSFTQTIPDRLVINPGFRYVVSGITTQYTATQLFNMGFHFFWSDTCNGDNFISLDSFQNEVLSTTSSLFVPTFIKNGLESEACQITLRITNPTGMVQNYQIILNFSDTNNNRNDAIDCDRDPSTTRPKVRLVCPTVMTETPQLIEVDVCDAQMDISQFNISGSQWSLSRNSGGHTIFTKTGLQSNTYATTPSGSGGSYRFLLVPHTSFFSDAQLSAVGAYQTIYSYPLERPVLIQPKTMQISFQVRDRVGNSGTAQCTFAVDPDMSLDIPTDYFTRPR